MSWSSEFEPPPPRPNVELDEQNEAEAATDESVDAAAPTEPEAGYDEFWAESPAPSDLPDDGPLDPAIFDGLFADLTPTDADDADNDVEAEVDDASEADDSADSDIDVEANVEADVEADDAAQADVDDDDDDVVEQGAAEEDEEPLEAVDLDQLVDDELDEDETAEDDSDADDTASDSDDSSGDADPVDTTPAPPVEPTRDVEPDLTAEPDHAADDAPGFDPEETLFDVPAEAALDQTADVSTNGNGVDPSSTISVSSQEELQQLKPEHPLELPQVPVSEPAYTANPESAAQASPPPAAPAVVATGPVASQVLAEQAKPGRWRSFAVAIAIGAGLGIGGAVLLSQLVGRSDSNDTTASTETPTGDSTGNATSGDTDAATSTDSSLATDADQAGDTAQPAAGMSSLGTNGRFELNSLRFEPGSLALTETGQTMFGQAATVASQRPGSVLSVVVRTYSEPTSAGNLELSKSQAQAVVDGLIGLGVEPDAIHAVGIGAPPLSTSQPVQNFVVVGAGLQSTALKSAIRDFSPFAIGIDPLSNQLRAESVAQLDLLGEAMTADPETSISLAGYAYERADAALNQAQAAVAAETAAGYLVANHQIDPNRIALLTPGEAPYIVATGTGNHISMRWGDIDQEPTIVTEADQAAISFAGGSVNLSPEATQALDGLVAASLQSNASWVIDVHTGSESGQAANDQLGERQAATIVDYLAQAGLGADRVRVYSGGNLRQFDETGTESRVVITQVP